MADTESLGLAGVEWLERMAQLPPRSGACASRPSPIRAAPISPPPHRLKQQPWMLDLERRAIAAFEALGVLMTEYLHQLPDDHAAGARRARRLRRHRRGHLFEQRLRRALELRRRTVRAERGAHRPHAALWLSSRRAAPCDAPRQCRARRRASSTIGARWAPSSAGSPATIGRCRVAGRASSASPAPTS